MLIAGAINASMLIVVAALFFKNGLFVEDLDVAFQQFGHLVSPMSAALFGIEICSLPVYPVRLSAHFQAT